MPTILNLDLIELLLRPRETLDIEIKEWLDLTSHDQRANVAKEIIALAHPDFREDLERQAYENRLIPRGVSFRCRVKKSEDLQKAQGFQ